MQPDLNDARFGGRALLDGLRPERCPLCGDGVLVCDVTAADPVYQCAECATRWVRVCSAS